MPQISAIQQALEGIARLDVPAIADGGIRYSGDIAKAPQPAQAGHARQPVRRYRGIAGRDRALSRLVQASRNGIAGRNAGRQLDRYFQDTEGEGASEKLVPEGIEGRVPYKGALVGVIHQLMGGLRAAMGYCGCATIDDLRTRAEFVEITSAGVRESHVHDVQIVKEAPNYRVD